MMWLRKNWHNIEDGAEAGEVTYQEVSLGLTGLVLYALCNCCRYLSCMLMLTAQMCVQAQSLVIEDKVRGEVELADDEVRDQKQSMGRLC